TRRVIAEHRSSRKNVLGVRWPMRSLSTSRVEVPFSARFHSVRSGRNPDGTLVEGLRTGWSGREEVMSSDPPFAHLPVMVDSVVDLILPVPPGVLLDATLGGAGHARAILDAAPHLSLIGLDQDPDAVAASWKALAPYGDRARVELARFDRLDQVLDRVGITRLSAALFDLGVSSPQLDRPDRGFSYRAAGPLDMRMDQEGTRSASEVVNTWPEAALVQLFRASGEVRFARRIARAVIAARPVASTAELAEVVRDAIPAAARRTGGHPARRIFQAIRIAVNEELEVLPVALDAAIARLAPGGRCIVLSYHSGEDRIVKDRFRAAATGGCICPPGLPCVCGAQPAVRLLTRGARRPAPDETEANRRAESARLRAVERLDSAHEPSRRTP
ncbi:MAG TPA: 16S rRNA (cytosine(1402)-N(4))-methyltransferase RsmH, partial [Acidimicrobiales bacterium]|nr:16S rRNA (cytosine(1402)-N(4))-methyltransferase RsmH [Acidimicrobiales bacterium]